VQCLESAFALSAAVPYLSPNLNKSMLDLDSKHCLPATELSY
jgi:hypothetical protein